MPKIKKGSRVKVFDHGLFVDDKTTPLSVTMKQATVTNIYLEKRHPFRWLADVEFDYRPNEISKGHFVSMFNEIGPDIREENN